MSSIDYILTAHAESRMKERGISRKEVELVLADPDTTHPGLHGDINMIKTINGRKIRIAWIMDNKTKRILTAMVVG
jgi:hypothetical protein